MNYLLTTVTGILVLLSCSRAATNRSRLSEARIGDVGFVYRHEGYVVYEACAKMPPLGDALKPKPGFPRYCVEANNNEARVEWEYYKAALAVAFEFDKELIAQGLDEAAKRLAFDKERLKTETDSAKIKLLEQRIKRYEAAIPRIETYNDYIDRLNMNIEHPLHLDQTIDRADIDRLLAPFRSKLIGDSNEEIKASPSTGLHYVRYKNVCWPAAMGIKSEQPCLGTEDGDSFVNIYAQADVRGDDQKWRVPTTVVVDGTNAKVISSPSCGAKMGHSWRVATIEQMRAISGEDREIEFPAFDREGKLWHVGSKSSLGVYGKYESYYGLSIDFEQTDWKKFIAESKKIPRTLLQAGFEGSAHLEMIQAAVVLNHEQCVTDFKCSRATPLASHTANMSEAVIRDRLDFGVLCVAPAKAINPGGDIDEDGIANSIDQCNRLPKNLNGIIASSGPRIGCETSELTDAEIGSVLGGEDLIAGPIEHPGFQNGTDREFPRDEARCTVPGYRANFARSYPCFFGNKHLPETSAQRIGSYCPSFRWSDGKVGAWEAGTYKDVQSCPRWAPVKMNL